MQKRSRRARTLPRSLTESEGEKRAEERKKWKREEKMRAHAL